MSSNLYKKLIFCIIGDFEVECDFSSILPTTEDFLWFALHQVSNKTSIDDLRCLQTVVRESYGEAYFKADSQPMTYFLVLLMTLQYEYAIEFLIRCNSSKMLYF